MDWNVFWTVGGFSIAVVWLIYAIVRNFKKDFNEKFELVENRVFQLAMGRTFQSILKEEREKRKRK